MSYEVHLTYFKPSGKYYSQADYTTDETSLYEIFQEVRKMVEENRLPGLVGGGIGDNFAVLVNVPGHPHEHPLLIPSEGEGEDQVREVTISVRLEPEVLGLDIPVSKLTDSDYWIQAIAEGVAEKIQLNAMLDVSVLDSDMNPFEASEVEEMLRALREE